MGTDTSTRSLTLTSTPPRAARNRDWRRYAKGARLETGPFGGTLTFQPARGLPTGEWTAPIGTAPGSIARCLRLSGRFSYGSLIVALDHFVFVDADGTQVGTAIRRAAYDSDPEHAWWPVNDVRRFLTPRGVPVSDKVIGSSMDLDAQFPGLLAQDPLLKAGPNKRRLFGR